MTARLEKAFAEASKLSPSEQDALAEWLFASSNLRNDGLNYSQISKIYLTLSGIALFKYICRVRTAHQPLKPQNAILPDAEYTLSKLASEALAERRGGQTQELGAVHG